MKNLILTLFVVASLTAFGQKKQLIENEATIIEKAIAEIDLAMKGPEGSLFLASQEYGISGEYTFDIQIYEKGKVASVFCKSREGGDIPSQNRLKDLVKAMSFNFKMPKGKKYKFTYTFKFNQ